jgi:DNA-binding Lrp family transcriptional regulator
MSLVSIAEKSGLTPKTVANKLKYLERKGVIIGYFMTLDTIKFNHNIFQLLVQIKNSKKISEFESYLCSLKNINCIFKMLGLWDYELDFIYSNMTDLQKQIEIMKEKFPNIIRKIEILSIGKRIVTNKENFLM